ncbi:hemagglutinin repeat-containing protein [Comamonas testosteroni]|nr:hemagglutinin repeat-containing protein [Comamonas testosteroni]
MVSGKQVVADVGGDLKLESLQDSSSYASRNQSAGGSLTISPAGVPIGGGLNAGQSKVNSHYQSVTEQSGIQAGDGGFQVSVKGDTDLKGAVIASNQTALEQGKNRFSTDGALTTSDLHNSARYEGQAVGVHASVGNDAGKFGVKGVGAGVGQDSGSAQGTTTAGISGIAGDQSVRTGDATGIERIFDQNKVQREIDAQVAITAEFGKQASKAAGTYADQQAIAARRAGNEAEAKKWDEDGEYRRALHTGIGALTGGLGGAVGGASGAAAGLNQAGNNYISHSPFRQVRQTASQENARLLNACGANCTQVDLLSIDQQVAQVERAANLAAIAQVSSMTQHQAQELAQLLLELAPVYGTGESALQLITGKSSLTGEEASRFWAAIGVVPVAGGVLKKVGEPVAEAISQSFKRIALETKHGPNLGEYKGGSNTVDETLFYLRENELRPQKDNLTGLPETPVKNANDEMVRSIKSQNEAGQIIADHGFSVEYLPNTGRPGPNPDLKINGQLADVYSPSGKNLQTIRDTVVSKSENQAPNVVINLADTPLNIT